MRIGLAVGYFDPHVGGSEEVVKRLALGLVSRGHDVIIATSPEAGRRHDAMVCPVIEFDVRGRSATGMNGDVAGYQRFLKESDRDVWLFYAAQIWSTDAALTIFKDIPAACVVVPCGYSGLADPAYGPYFESLPGHLLHADALVYMSTNYQDFLHDLTVGLGPLAHVIPNGADDDEFGWTHPAFRSKQREVLCVANHYRQKGHRAVIQAFRQAAEKDDRLYIIGEVHGHNPRMSCWLYCKLMAIWDHRIILLRCASRVEVIQHYKSADVFLFGSRVEAAPLVIIEAMAAGVPFVSTPAGNIWDYSDAGLIAVPARLGKALKRLLDDSDLQTRLGDRGRARWSASHRWSVITRQYEQIFESVIDAPRASLENIE